MQTTSDRLSQLQQELDALKQVQTQEDFDEGARLHMQKNAPWVSGMYSHLPDSVLHPHYVYKPYPKALYHVNYAAKLRLVQEANSMLVSGSDMSRELAVQRAMAELDQCVCKVDHEGDERLRLGSGTWAAGPNEAEALRLKREADLATQAGHLNYDDRNLIGKAKEERDEADALAEDHLVDVTATLKHARRPKRETAHD